MQLFDKPCGFYVNAFLFLASFYVLLTSAAFINMFKLRYWLFQQFEEQTIQLTFVSPFFDKACLYVLSALMLLSPLVVTKLRYGAKWFLFNYSLLIPASLMYAFGVRPFGEAFLLISGFSSLTTMLIHAQFLPVKASLTRLAIYLCCFLLVIEVLSTFSWIICPLMPNHVFVRHLIDLDAQLFYVPAGLLSILLVFTLFSWVTGLVRPRLGSVREVRVRVGRKVLEIRNPLTFDSENVYFPERIQPRLSILAVLCSIVLVIFYALYPHFPSLNPEGRFVGVDVPLYVRWLGKIAGEEWPNSLSYAFFELRDRPLGLLLMYGVWKVTGLPSWDVAQFTPLVLGPLLVLSVYFFMREATSGSSASLVATLFTAFSFHVTVGMFAASLLNWIGLIEVFLFSGLLLKSLRKKSWRWVLSASLCSISLLFTHAYTWSMLLGVVGVYTLLLLLRWLVWKGSSSEPKMVVVVMVVNIAVDIVKNYMLGSLGVATETINIAKGSFGLEFLMLFWNVLSFTLRNEAGGFYTNPLLFLLALVGAFTLLSSDESPHLYLKSWLMASSIPFVLANRVIQPRILYNIPFHIFAALGLVYFSKFIGRSLSVREARFLQALFFFIIILMNVNYGFRCMFTLSGSAFDLHVGG